jgi:hypothetical protein
MARIVVAGNLVRFPMGGASQHYLAFLVGLQQLGHEVFFVDKARWPDACYDVPKRVNTDDCSYGIAVTNALLQRYGLADRWCYVDVGDRHHGLSRERLRAVFESADVFLELDGSGWENESTASGIRVLIDGEPGWQQIQMENSIRAGEQLAPFDYYYTVGHNIGTDQSTSPTGGQTWGTIFVPILVDRVAFEPSAGDGPFTSVMRWRTNKSVTFNGMTYGQKDLEFPKFMNLPRLTRVPMEVAISRAPRETLEVLLSSGWRVCDADEASASFESYWHHVRASRGVFAVCKHVHVATNTGVFVGDPGWYMASGRPAVVQETGFSAHLPCGKGLFAVRTAEEAAAAIEAIVGDYMTHARAAREIAAEYLDAPKVLGRLLREIGLS